jgi:hypothetical protein
LSIEHLALGIGDAAARSEGFAEGLAGVRVDALEKALGKLPQLEMPLTHRFTPGLYVRTIFMPKGALVISRIHKTTHPFVVTQGHCAVWDEANGVQHVRAGHIGITTPGTRRILFMFEDTVWTTFHPGGWGPETDPDKIVAEVTEAHDVSNAPELSAEALGFLRRLPAGDTADYQSALRKENV